MTVAVTSLGSARFDLPDELPAGYLLIGDAASIPAISAILTTVPPQVPIELYLEQHNPADRLIPLPSHPRLRLKWVPRRDEGSLAAAVEARDWSNWYGWVACESGSLKHIRRRLREEFGFPKSELHMVAYWIHGRTFGTRRSPADTSAPEVAEQVRGARPSEKIGFRKILENADDSAPGATSSVLTDAGGDTANSTVPGADGAEDSDAPAPSVGKAGVWRSQAAGRLIAPLRPALIVGGVAQGLINLVQLAPFVLLAELARLLLVGAPADQLWTVAGWAVGLMVASAGLAALTLGWLHSVDARFEVRLRRRLLSKLARLPLGWFSSRNSGQITHLVHADTLSVHYLVTHAVPDAVAAVVAPLAVLGYLFVVDW